jgi:hypothetical protein
MQLVGFFVPLEVTGISNYDEHILRASLLFFSSSPLCSIFPSAHSYVRQNQTQLRREQNQNVVSLERELDLPQ